MFVPCTLILCGPPALAQGATVKARIELLHEARKVKNASNAVIWLTPLGTTVEPPVQTTIPKLEQRNKMFHPPLVVVPVGGIKTRFSIMSFRSTKASDSTWVFMRVEPRALYSLTGPASPTFFATFTRR
jgi:hypothetical protein